MNDQNIIVFTGAGFCVPMGLPTTNQFKHIIDRFDSTPIGIALFGYLGEEFYYDIEHVLSSLDSFSNQSSLIKHILEYPPYQGNGNEHGYLKSANAVYKTLTKAANTLSLELKRSLFDVLSVYDTVKSEKLYENLLNEIYTHHFNPSISFFTTNYDLTFEDAQDNLESVYSKLGITKVDYGFTEKNQRFIYDNNNKYNFNPTTLEYKKLHGSLDWSINNDRVYKSGNIIKPTDLEKMLLIYPGNKGTPKNEPYISLHRNLLERLIDAARVYVIGFAFRDDYINSQFDTALKINKDLEVYCINPSEIKNYPKESKTPYFVKTYPKRFIYIKKSVNSDDEFPLDLKSFLKH